MTRNMATDPKVGDTFFYDADRCMVLAVVTHDNYTHVVMTYLAAGSRDAWCEELSKFTERFTRGVRNPYQLAPDKPATEPTGGAA